MLSVQYKHQVKESLCLEELTVLQRGCVSVGGRGVLFALFSTCGMSLSDLSKIISEPCSSFFITRIFLLSKNDIHGSDSEAHRNSAKHVNKCLK